MDTLTTPVLLVTIATNSKKGSLFYRAVRVLYRGGSRDHESVSDITLRQSVSEVSICQSASGMRVSQSVAEVSRHQ
jgi:hypothetical protein